MGETTIAEHEVAFGEKKADSKKILLNECINLSRRSITFSEEILGDRKIDQ